MKLSRFFLGLSLLLMTTSCSLFEGDIFSGSSQTGSEAGTSSPIEDSSSHQPSSNQPSSHQPTSNHPSSNQPSSSSSKTSSSSSSVTPTPDPNIVTFDDVFDINNTLKVDIHVSNSELHKIQNDYYKYSERGLKSPIYRLCDRVDITITKNGKDHLYSYEDVGIRMKGNTSRHSFIDGNNIYSNIHFKLSFEETFDNPLYYSPGEYKTLTAAEKLVREDRKFFEMSKLDLRYNKNQDHSYIREYYALEMYRDFGILSQHSNFGQVVIHQNGNQSFNYGLYLVTEPITKTFIKRSLQSSHSYIGMSSWSNEKKGKVGVSGSNYGQFYKASYGLGSGGGVPNMNSTSSHLFGIEPDDASYLPAYELKSNTDKEDHTLIKNMINTLKSGSATDIASVVDMDYFAMYEAVATLLGDPEDVRNNYNNYAMYFRRTDGKMVIIPIDQDRVLGISKDWDPAGNAMAEVSPFADYAAGMGGEQQNQLYKKTILSNTPYKTAYQEALQKVLESKWVQNSTFNAIYETVKNHYSSVSRTSISNLEWSLNDYYSGTDQNMSFSRYIDKKIKTINNALGNGNGNNDKRNIIANCKNFFLTGTMDNWSKTSEQYRFKSIGNNQYLGEYIINPKDFRDDGTFQCKVYTTDGDKWLRCENGDYLEEGGGNIVFKFTTADYGQTLQFTINTSTGKMSWTISHDAWVD